MGSFLIRRRKLVGLIVSNWAREIHPRARKKEFRSSSSRLPAGSSRPLLNRVVLGCGRNRAYVGESYAQNWTVPRSPPAWRGCFCYNRHAPRDPVSQWIPTYIEVCAAIGGNIRGGDSKAHAQRPLAPKSTQRVRLGGGELVLHRSARPFATDGRTKSAR